MGQQQRNRAPERERMHGHETDRLADREATSTPDGRERPRMNIAAALDMLSDDSMAYLGAERAERAERADERS